MTQRHISKIVNGMAAQDGAGVKLKRILGQPALQNLDPFLMLDEFGSDNPNDYLAGFPPHPHRGFQTVTYMLEGKMLHQDSVGNKGLIEAGGIQWMNAGKGIIHEELPEHSDKAMRGFQLWVNLPASKKMSAPYYQDIPAGDVPTVEIPVADVKVLAGCYKGATGPVNTASIKPLFLDLLFKQAGTLIIPLPATHNALLYCYEGQLLVGGQTLAKGQLAVLDDGEQAVIEAPSAESRGILVAGEPIGEPVVQYGPFVMNTEQEIQQALSDFRNGTLA